MKKQTKILIVLLFVATLGAGAFFAQEGGYFQGLSRLGKPTKEVTQPSLQISTSSVPMTSIVGANQVVAAYKMSVDGPSHKSSVLLNGFDISCSGSYTSNSGFIDNVFKIYVDGDLLTSVSAANDTCENGTKITFNDPIEIFRNSAVDVLVEYDTSVDSGQKITESVVFTLSNPVILQEAILQGSYAGPTLEY